MGKHLKTSMDEKVIDYLAIELYKKDPNNIVLNKFMSMKNEEGYSLTKTINKFKEQLLLGVYGSGLLLFNPKTGETKDFPLIEKEKKSKEMYKI